MSNVQYDKARTKHFGAVDHRHCARFHTIFCHSGEIHESSLIKNTGPIELINKVIKGCGGVSNRRKGDRQRRQPKAILVG